MTGKGKYTMQLGHTGKELGHSRTNRKGLEMSSRCPLVAIVKIRVLSARCLECKKQAALTHKTTPVVWSKCRWVVTGTREQCWVPCFPYLSARSKQTVWRGNSLYHIHPQNRTTVKINRIVSVCWLLISLSLWDRKYFLLFFFLIVSIIKTRMFKIYTLTWSVLILSFCIIFKEFIFSN